MKRKTNLFKKTGAMLLAASSLVVLLASCGSTGNSGTEPGAEASSSAVVSHPAPEISSPAPEFSIELLSGEIVSLSDYKGKAVLLNFWATWCGPCVKEMPDIQELTTLYSEDELVVLAVNVGETPPEVQGFIEENGYTFAVGLDTDNTVSSLYPADGIPYTVMIDPEGIIVDEQVGSTNNMLPRFQEMVDKALADSQPAEA